MSGFRDWLRLQLCASDVERRQAEKRKVEKSLRKLEVKIQKAKTQIKKFKILVSNMYRGFPNYPYPVKFVELAVESGSIRDKLVEDKFFMKGKLLQEERDYYGLAPGALPLISSWRMERLTLSLWVLTVAVIILMLFQTYTQIKNDFLLGGLGAIGVIAVLTVYHEVRGQ